MVVEYWKEAERILTQLIEAEKKRAYPDFIKFFEPDAQNMSEEQYQQFLDSLTSKNGSYVKREYMGYMKGAFPESYRFVWRGAFEKNDVVILLTIVKRGDHFGVMECGYH